jgi:hypothetical protein
VISLGIPRLRWEYYNGSYGNKLQATGMKGRYAANEGN